MRFPDWRFANGAVGLTIRAGYPANQALNTGAAIPTHKANSDSPEPISRAVQDYLKTIHRLGGADDMVTPVQIAERLGVRAPSVTGMLKRLAEGGWISYEPGHGARLT